MTSPTRIACAQLLRQPGRFAIAVAGVVFAVVLILMQLGFSDALYESSVRLHRQLRADLVVVHPHYAYLANPTPFTQRRVDQARAHPDVIATGAIYYQLAPWKNPLDGSARNLLVIGVAPIGEPLALENLSDRAHWIRVPDVVWFDRRSRAEFGFLEAYASAGGGLLAEIANRRVRVAGTYDLGTSFAVDGSVVTSEDNFLRLLPQRQRGVIDIGTIRLRPGADIDGVRAALERRMPNDVIVLTIPEFIAREQAWWRSNTPIGYVFTFGALMSFVVGCVVVYQILFVNVADRLRDYATLKAIGYRDAQLYGVVLRQAGLLAVLGFTPGCAAAFGLYRLTAWATQLPMDLTIGTAAAVFALTALMCALSGAAALRKVGAADPAEVFA